MDDLIKLADGLRFSLTSAARLDNAKGQIKALKVSRRIALKLLEDIDGELAYLNYTRRTNRD